MKINNIGYNHFHDADFSIRRPNGSGDYLMLILKTAAFFEFDGKRITTEPNSFILYKKGTPQYYFASGEQFGNDWFHFDMQSDDIELISSLQIPFDKVVSIGDINSLSQIIKSMCYENYSTNLYKTDSMELYLKLFFLKLSEKIQNSADDNVNSYYDKMSILRTKIYNMPYESWNVEWLAHEMTLSKSYFQHLYKQTFGVSAISDVINSRVEHGKYLLTSTDFSIKHIAERCGYDNDIHFMRQFKNKLGVTPSEYREAAKSGKTAEAAFPDNEVK